MNVFLDWVLAGCVVLVVLAVLGWFDYRGER